ncbi:uncharacterized protein A4U43_C05F27950 [Asparagus officinalis]|uniref:DUF4408 domain-containing protein n=1 Tax=Asparagus officinalis TaxID=4686 RepID=A0A5P1EWL2_ASPOF|nr:uncharacterized protein LOC109843372 [Asparagus officinalis]ONK69893.1 uncharacterized protein A4U43_C05F27950 [Asparagus officinalis]
MQAIKKSQLAKIFLLVLFLTLLFLAPFIPSSRRTSYLYFILNLLVVVLGAEAGFLSAISKPHEEKKPLVTSMSTASPVTETVSEQASRQQVIKPVIIGKPLVVEEEKKVNKEGLKRCKSRPSLFFIASFEPEREEEKEEVEMEKEEEVVVVRNMVGDIGELSKQELFMKAEMFIGNFYKQLKMQRENSWQKLQGLYHKAF